MEEEKEVRVELDIQGRQSNCLEAHQMYFNLECSVTWPLRIRAQLNFSLIRNLQH